MPRRQPSTAPLPLPYDGHGRSASQFRTCRAGTHSKPIEHVACERQPVWLPWASDEFILYDDQHTIVRVTGTSRRCGAARYR